MKYHYFICATIKAGHKIWQSQCIDYKGILKLKYNSVMNKNKKE